MGERMTPCCMSAAHDQACDCRARTEDLRNALAAYGARLGIVEPLLHGMARQIPEMDDIIAELQAKKEYAISDRLRAVVQEMRENASDAFPGRYP